MQEQWYLYCRKADFRAISDKFNISPMLARILVNRGIKTDEEINMFLNGSVKDMYDPFLLKGMDCSVDLILNSIKNNEKILIIGDYDADGVCSAYILYSYLEFLKADVSVRLPDRVKDGYGMNEKMAYEAFCGGVGLIITCDNGISANSAAAKAKELGIKVLITDHHTPPEVLPSADCIINPKQPGCPYPYKEICGSAVAYKLVCALDSRVKNENNTDSSKILDYLFQFAAIATITDIVPLKDENRIFAQEGLKRLKATENPGLKALFKIKSVDVQNLNSFHVGFIIGPAINSAGRLKNAGIAFDFLNEKDPDEAYKKALLLSELNDERKKLTAEQTVLGLKEAENKKNKILVCYLPKAHESVAGIIAGKIKDAYNAPAFVITNSKEGLKGSGRSIESYNMIEEISKFPWLFSKFGGHAMACGFTLRVSVGEFEDVLNKNCALKDEDLIKKIWIDMQLPFEYATQNFIEELKQLEPFGMDNQRPLFAEKNITVLNSSIVGKNSSALKMRLKNKNNTVLDGIMFADEENIAQINEKIKNSPEISLTYYPEINEFRGRKNIQLKIQDIRFS